MIQLFPLTLEWCLEQKLPFLFFPEVGSTQEFAKTLPLSEPAECLVLAQHQTQGKGRFDRTWQDQGEKQGGQFLGSFVFKTSIAPQPLFPVRVGLGLFRAFAKHPELKFLDSFSIKPPNDLFLGDKKVAGLLIEVVSTSPQDHRVIVGLGLNLLTHPKQGVSGAFKDFSDPNAPGYLWNSYWKNALSRFRSECKKSLELGSAPLDAAELADLNAAMGAGSNRPSPVHSFVEIDAHGNLIAADPQAGRKKVSWSDL